MMKKDPKSPIFHEREDWTLFRSLDTLAQRAGINKKKIPALVAKEVTDNALDTGANCEVGSLSDGGFYVEDNGPGIPGSNSDVASLFSIKRQLRSTKYIRLPQRGALGVGLRIVAGAVLATCGILRVFTKGRKLLLIPEDDGNTQFEQLGNYNKPGTRIEITLPGFQSSKYLEWSRVARSFARGLYYKGKSSPYWYTSEDFYELLQSTPDEITVKDFIAKFDGCSGRKSGFIAKDFIKRPVSSLEREETEKLLKQARGIAKPVKAYRLGYVGLLNEFEGYSKVEGKFTVRTTRGKFDAEIPVVIEAWATKAEDSEAYFLVNRSPITGTIHSYPIGNELNIFGCGCRQTLKVGNFQVKIWVNVITPYMPFTSDGKEPDFSHVNVPISEAIETSILRLKRLQKAGSTETVPKKSQKAVILANLDNAIDKVSGSGKYRYSSRQLFYVMRDVVSKEIEKDLSEDNYNKIIADHENEIGRDLPGIYRDARGTLYHPHRKEEIPLGTLGVEGYKQPEWTFNKIIYLEKEGFFEILKDEKWPEKNDCALLTSKGFATRAAKDVIDLLGESIEEITFFCIHDADASGTMIYETLVEATKARPKRKVNIINLGLEPWEGMEMGLSVEVVKKTKKRRKPVAHYITEPPFESVKWKEWLQTNRIELNAMTTPQFLEWLDTKMEMYRGKLIPPYNVLSEELIKQGRSAIQDDITEEVLKKARIEEKVKIRFNRLLPIFKKYFARLPKIIREELLEAPADLWVEPIKRIARRISKKS